MGKTSVVSTPLVTFWDRGLDGTIVGCHNQGGYGPGPVYGGVSLQSPSCSTSNTTVRSEPPLAIPGQHQIANGGILYQPKSDGYNTLQGVRMMDSVTGYLTTPDAYVGNVTDPASKKPFIWDGNNPEVYSDPTDFQAVPAAAPIIIICGAELTRYALAELGLGVPWTQDFRQNRGHG